MNIEYKGHYDARYWQGRKTYHAHDGSVQVYHGPALVWDGFAEIARALAAVFPKGPLLDIGCGGGDLAGRMMTNHGFDSWGVDVSDYAVANCVPAMQGRTALRDITTCPELPMMPAAFDLVMATDLLEHIYAEDLDKTFAWILGKARRWLFFCVATTFDTREFVAEKGKPIPPEYEGTAVSGHVHVRTFEWWARFFKERHGLRIDWARMYGFQARREQSPAWRDTMGWNMQTTFCLERR